MPDRPPTADNNEMNKAFRRRQQKNNENNLLIPCVIIQTFRQKEEPYDSVYAAIYIPVRISHSWMSFFLFGQYCLPYQYIEMSAAGLLNGQTAISTVSNMQGWSKTPPLNRVELGAKSIG